MPRATIRFLGAVACAVAVGAALRLQHLSSESMWIDEVSQYEWTEGTFRDMLRAIAREFEPPLNDFTAYAWNALVRGVAPGLVAHEGAIRVPVLLFGLATIPVVAWAARASFGAGAGVLAALLLATNPCHVRYSQEARMYALATLLTATALLFLVRALSERARRRDALAFALCSAAAVAAHYVSILSFLAALAATALSRARRRDSRLTELLRWECVALVPCFALVGSHALWPILAGEGTHDWLAQRGAPGIGDLGSVLSFLGFHRVHLAYPALIAAGLGFFAALLFLGGAASRGEGEPEFLRLHLALMALGPPLALWSASQVRNAFLPRYLLFVIPALVLLSARARPFGLAAGLASVPIAWGLILQPLSHAALEKANYREAAQALAAEARPDDLLVVDDLRLAAEPMRFYVRSQSGTDSAAWAVIGRIRAAPSGPESLPARLLALETHLDRSWIADRRKEEPERWHLVRETGPGMIRLWRRDP